MFRLGGWSLGSSSAVVNADASSSSSDEQDQEHGHGGGSGDDQPQSTPSTPTRDAHQQHHRRNSSLDEASMSDLTSTSYQNASFASSAEISPPAAGDGSGQQQHGQHAMQQEEQEQRHYGQGPALDTSRSSTGSENTGRSQSQQQQQQSQDNHPLLSHSHGQQQRQYNSNGNGAIAVTPITTLRRPPRITHQSRLESIPSVGYTNSQEMSSDDDHEYPAGPRHGLPPSSSMIVHDVSASSTSSYHAHEYYDSHSHHEYQQDGQEPHHHNGQPQGHHHHQEQRHHLGQQGHPREGNIDKYNRHLQKYASIQDKLSTSHQTDVTDSSTVESESEWTSSDSFSPHSFVNSSNNNIGSSASTRTGGGSSQILQNSPSRSTKSSCSTSTHGRPRQPPQQQHRHSFSTSFNSAGTDGDVDTDDGFDGAFSPMERTPSPLQGRRTRSTSAPLSTPSSSPSSRRSSFRSSPIPIRERSRPPSRAGSSSSRPPSRAGRPPPPSRSSSSAGSISNPRYAVEFRHRKQHTHQHAHPADGAPSAAAAAAAAAAFSSPGDTGNEGSSNNAAPPAVPVYDRDGRHLEYVAMDVEDPYLSQGSSAEDVDNLEDSSLEEEKGASQYHQQQRLHRQSRQKQQQQQQQLFQRKLGQQHQQQWVDAHGTPAAPYGVAYQPPIRTTGSFGGIIKPTGSFGSGGPGMVGSLLRTVRTILVLGALGAAAVIIRAHFLLAGGRAAASATNGIFSDGGIAAVRMASGALALPQVTSLLSSAAVRESLLAERAVLRERVQRIARTLPDGRPISTPQNMALLTSDGSRRLAVKDGIADETYAVRLMPTAGRRDLTDAAVERLAPCSSIADVRLMSEESVGGTPSALGGWGDEGSVVKRAGLTTDAVLLLADDIAFTCGELDRAFNVWSKDPDRMVGFYTYDLLPSKSGRQPVSYALGEVKRGGGRYSVVSDRAAFIHRSYLTSLTAKAAKDAVSEWKQSSSASGDAAQQFSGICDSLTLSLAATAVSAKAPLAVASSPLKLRELSESASSKDDDSDSATECLLSITSALAMQVLPSEQLFYVGSS